MDVIFVIGNLMLLHICKIQGDTGNSNGSVLLQGDPRLCLRPTDTQNLRFEVLPGAGWDNLLNKEKGRVLNVNYTQCKLSEDGLYLIPDGVTIVPVKSSKVDTFAELFEHLKDYTSTLSRSINIDAGLQTTDVGISGHFSEEFESIKEKQFMEKSSTIRIQARYIRYTAFSEPDTPLHPGFRNRLKRIASHLELNRTSMARYESQLLIRDFGTNVIRSIDVGAALEQLDHVSSSYIKQSSSDKKSILASASATFFMVFNIGISYSQKTSQAMIDQYTNNRAHSKIHTFGGPAFQPNNYSVNDWIAGLDDNLVALDRSGDPIYYVITPDVLPEISESIVYQLYNYIQDAVQLYYEHNTYRGCTDMDSPNFNYQANMEDGTCETPLINCSFGGVYQKCSPGSPLNCNIVNQETLNYSCPEGYKAYLLHKNCPPECYGETFCCDILTNSFTYEAYWCGAYLDTRDKHQGLAFGGVFSNTTINRLTQRKSCPFWFYPVHLLTDLYVCVGVNHTLYIPFAGFYSCQSGNPYANSFAFDDTVLSYLTHMCPTGYSHHLAKEVDGCNINYCIKMNASTSLAKIQRPPFMSSPQEMTRNEPITLSDNGTSWKIMNISSWSKITTDNSTNLGINNKGELNADQKSTRDENNVKDFVVYVSVTLFCVFIATAVIVISRKLRS